MCRPQHVLQLNYSDHTKVLLFPLHLYLKIFAKIKIINFFLVLRNTQRELKRNLKQVNK